jgi:hypothetical protein
LVIRRSSHVGGGVAGGVGGVTGGVGGGVAGGEGHGALQRCPPTHEDSSTQCSSFHSPSFFRIHTHGVLPAPLGSPLFQLVYP